jgi:hypothetical protein
MSVPVIALLVLAWPIQDTQARFENHPSGELRAQYEVRVEPDGSEVRHGSSTSWYPDGQVESEGSYRNGLREGDWLFRWPNGRRKETGGYSAGRRDGPWRHYHESGPLRAEGSYRDGVRDGEWTFWTPDREVDAERSGDYGWRSIAEEWTALPEGVEEPEGLSRERRAEWLAEHEVTVRSGLVLVGATRDGIRTGRWSIRRADGSEMFVGTYGSQGPQGPWVFVHADGSADPGWISGRYEYGIRRESLEEWPPRGLEVPGVDVEPDPRRAPAPEHAPEALARLDAWLAADEADRPAAWERLLADRPAAFRAAVARLRDLDLDDPADHELGRRIDEELLLELWGAAWPWRQLGFEAAARDNARTVLRLLAFLELTHRRGSLAPFLDPGRHWLPFGVEWTLLAEPPLPVEFYLTGRRTTLGGRMEVPTWLLSGLRIGLAGPMDGRMPARFSRNRRLDNQQAAADEAITRALEWIVRNQSELGSWERGTEREIEATALCLLALLGEGHTIKMGDHQETVLRGLERLVRRIDLDSGRIVTGTSHDLRSHALALQALAEACYFAGSLDPLPALFGGTQRARDGLLAAQLEDGSWPLIPGGERGDAHVTARAWLALATCSLTRVDVDREAAQRALDWLDSVTRRGGETVVNTGDPVAVATAWTAFDRILAGRSPREDEGVMRQVSWLVAHPPSIEPGDERLDPEYVCASATVMYQVDIQAWRSWRATMYEQLLQVQHARGELAGSWDPTGVGAPDRSSVTAWRALALEAATRYYRLEALR